MLTCILFITGDDPVSINIVSKPVSDQGIATICIFMFCVLVFQVWNNQLNSTPVAIVATDRAQSLYR